MFLCYYCCRLFCIPKPSVSFAHCRDVLNHVKPVQLGGAKFKQNEIDCVKPSWWCKLNWSKFQLQQSVTNGWWTNVLLLVINHGWSKICWTTKLECGTQPWGYPLALRPTYHVLEHGRQVLQTHVGFIPLGKLLWNLHRCQHFKPPTQMTKNMCFFPYFQYRLLWSPSSALHRGKLT